MMGQAGRYIIHYASNFVHSVTKTA